jgi:hypothetical protein
MSSIFCGTGASRASFFRACSATGREMPKDTRAFNASSSNVLFINGEIFEPENFLPTLSRSSRMILSADFLPMPLMLSSCLVCPSKIALASSSGLIAESIIRAVPAPTPETLSSWINISFSLVSKKPKRISSSSFTW